MKETPLQQAEAAFARVIDVGMCLIPYEDLSDIIADDVIGFGTTKDEVMRSFQDVDDLFHSQYRQMEGIIPKVTRDRVSTKISPDGRSVTIVEFLALELTSEEIKNTLNIRASGTFFIAENECKMVHWHASAPVETVENDHWHIEEWKKEKEKLQQLVDEQTADLQIKNRELEIQASLERIRAVAMSMQKPEDMLKVCRVIADQLKIFGVEHIRNVQTVIVDEAKNTYDNYQYFAAYDREFVETANCDEQKTVLAMITRMLESPQGFFTGDLEGEDLADFRNYREQHNSFPDPLLDESESVNYHFFSIGPGGLGISLYRPISSEGQKIFKRFHEVFSLAYRRFRDIQKAEAQAREAQIEAALERVRARAMAMHQSEELADTASVVFTELKNLGIESLRSGMAIFDYEADTADLWLVADESGHPIRKRGMVHTSMHPIYQDWLEAGRENSPVFCKELKGEALRDYYVKAADIFKASVPQSFKHSEFYYGFFFFDGSINIIAKRPLTQEEESIGRRFANVFGLLYRRFLDLQKAEKQAKESRIEAALERVRNRSLAMRTSTELQSVVDTLFDELRKLDISMNSSSIYIYSENTKDWQQWVAAASTDYSTFFHVAYADVEIMRDFENARQQGVTFYSKYYPKAVKDEWFNYAVKHTDYPNIAESRKKLIQDSDCIILSFSIQKNTSLQLAKYQNEAFSEYENDVLKRMSAVFEQSYTRFLDLQKAEAQAKEAQIEAALERIRAKVTAMQESSDLLDIVVTMRTEFVNLGHEAGYFWHMRWLPDSYQKAMTSGDGSRIGMVMTLPRHIHGEIPLVNKWEKSTEPFVVYAMDTEAALNYVHKMVTLGDFQQIDPQAPTEDDIRHIEGLTFVMARTTHGEIGFSLPGKVNEPDQHAIETLVRFAGVFDLAYKRFEDLKETEHQHREAQIELGLERVRARTMAMQHSDELADASRVLDEQVRALGIETWGCAFHIYADNADGDYEWFSSANGNLPFYKTPRENFFLRFYEKGQRGETFHIEEFAGEDCKAHYDFLKTLPVAGDALKALEESGVPLPDYQIDHIAFFSHGYILFITYETVPEAHEIFRRFARVFEQTYTRFIDLQKLEAQALRAENDLIAIKAARHKAEEALSELKATQEQLVQQEKLASLGQLTAGIAHEIKNPLNFVNNFSDVSVELIDEALEQLLEIRGNEKAEEALEILGDVKSNLLKIHEHGSRADGIVKSMLQHSRGSSGKKVSTPFNNLVKESVNLAFHGMRAGRDPINVHIDLHLDDSVGELPLIAEDFSRVILNLCNNAFDAMRDKMPGAPPEYEPRLTVRTMGDKDSVSLEIADNGPGIPEEIREKILQPFFTTKKGTHGTGLGLSITYDIIKGHGGELKVSSAPGNLTVFSIILPNKGQHT